MKVFLVGKIRNITAWLEGCALGLEMAGHEVRIGVTRNPTLSPVLDRALSSRRLGRPRAQGLVHAVRRFSPDIILVVLAYTIPRGLLEEIAAMPGRPPLVGWVGDVFAEADRASSDLFDLIAYTDTAMVAQHERLGFRTPCIFLPHAANPRLALDLAAPPAPASRMVFIANPTPRRRALLMQVASPVRIFGPGWKDGRPTVHEIVSHRVGMGEVGQIYAGHFATLNIMNETNVLNGLNQRNFDPCPFGTAVVSDDQPDLGLCFDIGREAFAYGSPAELDDLYARLLRAPEAARAVGEAGRRRVLAEHTYAHRIDALMTRL
jgi:spore maturation protein CgeB